ncbi:alpha/beta hydrolase [Actinoplanes sp. LDG1-06]|uniref:Alpha/beta hydrolase n=1 Tax=Paractinoplanes ovalisporus TaxID=2810368 RepID=A0ABS2AA67_9ACTN|nr:alpha/beta hydrolase [Actinoplanes ovalisporus]MBM2616129.1 alpha/beta hydrolase [Actinoplanes ovalisporus]
MADAVVIPGGRNGSSAGLLEYAGDVPHFRGATVHRHDWVGERPRELFEPAVESWVCSEVAPVLDGLGGQPLLIGKSLGSFAAGLAAERSLPAVWLTPVLTVPWVPAALGRATAPFLLVGGTADPLWDRALAQELSPYVVEVPAANHGMYVPGPLTDTIAVLARVVVAIDEFLDDIGWP